jgi:bacillithiol system protein YtxJ
MYRKIQDIEQVVGAGAPAEVIIYKHSATCAVSAQAKRAVDAWMEQTGRDVYLVVVQEDRALSNAIAEKLNVRHESPQFIVFKAGKSAALDHFEITGMKIAALLS